MKGYGKKYGKHRRFTVYDNKTDLPVIVCGTVTQCALAMGVSANTFYLLVSQRTSKNMGNRWTIITEVLTSSELDEYNGGCGEKTI